MLLLFIIALIAVPLLLFWINEQVMKGVRRDEMENDRPLPLADEEDEKTRRLRDEE